MTFHEERHGQTRERPSMWRRVCATVFSHPSLRRLRTRRARRWLVGGVVLALIAMPLAGWLSGELWPVLGLMLPWALLSVALAASLEGLFDRPLSKLDERQRHLRQTVFREPYMFGATLGLAGGLMVAVALTLSEGLSLGVMLAVVGTITLLPSMAVAWRLPDEVDHGE